jgi:2-polyprenyl-6-methoxyphenol hydroxylase-like FAD-dependent oxidoreductase
MENLAAEVVIVGGGPAGLTAAIALAGAGIATALVDLSPRMVEATKSGRPSTK